MEFLGAIPVLLAVFLAVLVVTFRRRRLLRQLRGPSASFLLGEQALDDMHLSTQKLTPYLLCNLKDIPYQENVGDLDFQWVNEYGTAWRIGGTLGEDILMVADPKALQHIFHKSGYDYPRSVESQVTSRIVNGRGIVWAHGSVHQRHRKIMNPAFTAPQLRSFLPLFRRGSLKMCQQWKSQVLSGAPGGTVIPVNKWLNRLTMDVLGEAAFDFDFGALDNEVNEVSDAFNDMFFDSSLDPPLWGVIFKATWRYLPQAILDVVDYLPTREFARFRKMTTVMNKVSKQLIKEKTEALLSGDLSRKDAMSVLVRANVSEDPKSKLSEAEMMAQMCTLTLAGHETTANTITWFLWELAKNPHFQEELRKEVLAIRHQMTARGDTELTIDDLDSMPYLQAGMKETLRMHPIVYHLSRAAGKDDVIPLSYPIRTKSGQMVSEIPVKAGQNIMVSVSAYNRLPDVWGKDASIWNPMRFIEGNTEKEVKVGMYGNVMTFSAGVRGCIGWRFSVIETQAIMFDLLENFRFALPEEKMEVRRAPAGVIMGPVLKDSKQQGFLMPLHVTPI